VAAPASEPFAGLGLVVWRASLLDPGPHREELADALRRALEPLGWVVSRTLPVDRPERFLLALDDWNSYARYADEDEIPEPPVRHVPPSEYHPEDDPLQGETTARYEEGRMP
jgi:hypothetical protein